MRLFRCLAFVVVGLAALLCLASCGDGFEPLVALEYPYLEQATPLKVNGKELRAFVMTSEGHRRRGRVGLSVREGEVIAYVYPKMSEPLDFDFPNGVTQPVDLVFIDGDAGVVRRETVEPYITATFPLSFSVKSVRLVLQLPKGQADKLGLTVGSKVTTDPDLLKDADKAGEEFTDLYFVGERRGDEKPEEAPSVHLKMLDKPEEVGQAMKDRSGLKDGEGVLIAFSGGGTFDGFWLKETEGPICACYLEQTSGRNDRGVIIAAMYENLMPSGDKDLDRPVYSPPDSVYFLALFKGKTFFTDHKIQLRSRVAVTGTHQTPAEMPDYESLEIKFGSRKLYARVATEDSERKSALVEAPALKDNKAIVFNFEDPSYVEFDTTGLQGEARLLFVSGDGTGKYSVNERKLTAATPVKAGDIKDGRFAIAVPHDFDITGFEMPYALRDLQPSSPTVVFYDAKAEVVTDRWPKDDKGRAHVELAMTDPEQRKGLMYRTSLKPDHGMLFIYPDDQDDLSYWMKNCKMDLSIAFVDHKGIVVKIFNRMKAQPAGIPDSQLETYLCDAPARFAVEMEPDWFDKHNIKVGDRLYIPAKYTKSLQQ